LDVVLAVEWLVYDGPDIDDNAGQEGQSLGRGRRFQLGIVSVLICIHTKYNVIVSLSPLFDFAYDLRKKDRAWFRVYYSLPL